MKFIGSLPTVTMHKRRRLSSTSWRVSIWIVSFCGSLRLVQCDANGLNAYGLAQTVASVFSPQRVRPELGEGIHVISAGFGRGGALSEVLNEIGYSTYDYWSFFANGSNWVDFLSDHRNKTLLIEDISSEGYNAISDFPGGLLYKDVIALNRNAKVILVSPASPESSARWANDTMSTLFRMVDLSYRAPFNSLQIFMPLQKVFEKWALLVVGLPVVKTNKGKSLILPRPGALVEAYDDWVKTVTATVPADRLLILSSDYLDKHSLCSFLAPTNPVIERRCKMLSPHQLKTDTNLPKFLTVVAIMNLVADCYERLPLVLLMLVGVVNAILILCTSRRLRTPKPTKEKAE